MIVILEGVDGSGKTTLCNTLIVNGYNKISIESGNYEYEHWVDAILENTDKVCICDRSFITDLVYRIFDEGHRRGMDLRQMCSILSSDVIVIHLESGSEYDDAMKRGEDNITDVISHTRIKFLYRDIMTMLKTFAGARIIKYNWRTNDVVDIINFIERRKNDAIR
jgi:thymidylate kinase